MSKLKLSFSFLLAILFVGILSTAAFAAGSNPPSPYNNGVTAEGSTIQDGLTGTDQGNDNSYNTVDKSNANKTGSGVGGQTANFGEVIKSDDLVKNSDGSHGTQRTHGEYMNNTNSCASCHQTHTGASESLLFKDGRYQTCTACHDGTLGFYNVFTGSNSAGTFGGTHDGNMSAHLANGTVAIKAAPGGNKDATSGSWTEEFSCASCHAPHGSYSSRLLNDNPNDMANTPIEEGGQKVPNLPVVTDITAKVDSATVNYTTTTINLAKSYNFVAYRFVLADPVDAVYTAKGLVAGDTVLQIMKWDDTAGAKDGNGNPLGAYVKDTAPLMHGYDFDAAHKKHYWTAFKDAANKEILDTDMLKKGEILGNGFIAAPAAKTDVVTAINNVVSGKVARAYVVKLDVSAPDANNVTSTTASSLWASKLQDGVTANPGYKSGQGIAMSTFCAACHTDYLAKSTQETGTFDHAYRHSTNSDSYTCVRCHYAHGTDVTVMRDARGQTYDQILANTTDYFPTITDPTTREATVKDYLKDRNPSSALKRYTNMAVCWACHTSSHSEGTRNTDSYQYNPNLGIDTDRNGIEFDY